MGIIDLRAGIKKEYEQNFILVHARERYANVFLYYSFNLFNLLICKNGKNAT